MDLIFSIKLINPEEEVAGFQFGLNSNSIGFLESGSKFIKMILMEIALNIINSIIY